tara:strand:- start:28237 stop:28542 length:306 start_codon:yes stop_codon:yes gene_type:complete
MSDIPTARHELEELAKHLEAIKQSDEAATVRSVVDKHMTRKKFTRKAGTTSAKMTPALAREIQQYAGLRPEYSLQKIAAHFNVNPGRVSEALARKDLRKAE